MISQFKIHQWNCHSFKSNGPEYTWYLSNSKELPMIICLQETWFNKVEDIINIKGYDLIDYSMRENSRGGGTAIYARTSLSCSKKCVSSKFETSVIETRFKNDTITIINLYDASADTKYEDYLNLFQQIEGKFVLCGDFNAHHQLWGSNKNDSKGNSLCRVLNDNNNAVVLNDGSGTRQNPINLNLSCIDLTITNRQLAHQITWTADSETSFGSDHFLIEMIINQKDPFLTSEHEFIWNLNKANWDGFTSDCNTKLSPDMISEDVNETCLRLSNEIIDIAGKHIPVKKRRNKNKPMVPWWSDECTKAVASRNKIRNRVRHTGNGEDYLEYKQKERECKNIINKTQKLYWEEYCSKLNGNNNLSQVWKTIKNMMGKNTAPKTIPTLQYNGTTYETGEQKANILADTFAKVSSNSNYSEAFRQHKNEMEDSNGSNFKEYLYDNTQSYNEAFSISELKEALSDTTDSSPGKDKITYTMFKKLTDKSLGVLLLFYNKIWFTQKLPDSWKHSVIIPSFKKDKNPNDPNSYRPIALTSTFVKLMEKMIDNRLRWYLESNHLYNPNQSGFRQNRNTMDQLIRLENDIQKSFLKKETLIGVFIDFQKAFDMIWKHGLIEKMINMGIKGNMLGWVNSFLTNRTIQVKVNDTYSDILKLQNGTPQGSCISPTLFNIMVNDLPSCIKYCSVSQFADDSAIWFGGKNINFVQRRIQKDLHNLMEWCEKWGFLISPTKTVALMFTKNRKLDNLSLKLGQSILTVVNEIKFLGLIIDSKLSWLKHFQYVENRCSKVLNCMKALNGTKWGANSKTLRNIYIALIRSKIDYGCEVYCSASSSAKSILDRIQSQALRICTGSNKTTATSALQVEMGDPPYDERRKSLILKSCIKIHSQDNSHPTKESLSRKAVYLVYPDRINQNRKSYYSIANDLMVQFDIDTEHIYSHKYLSIPPWHLLKPNVNTQLTNIITKDDNPALIKSEFNIMRDTQYKNFLCIYTDGSKDPVSMNSSCAYVIPELKIFKGFKLPKHVSIFGCELMAIYLSLSWLEEFQPTNVVIFVDSLSALQSLQSNIFKINNLLIYDICFLYSKLYYMGMNIVLTWTPSHSGILGNDLADKIAKCALSKNSIDIDIPMFKDDIKIFAREALKNLWQMKWTKETTGRTLHNIQEDVNFQIKIPPMPRENECLLLRMRSGIIRTKKYLSKIGKSNSQECDICNVVDDIEHYLLHCKKYTTQRKLMFDSFSNTSTISLKYILSGKHQTFRAVQRYYNSTL